MPNWKKVIVSGSDAALNSLYAPSITGSLQGTASYAIYAETASFSYATSETRVLVINQTGFDINKGVVVRITGSNNASDVPRITTASIETDPVSANTLGITTQQITNGSQGYVITEGILTGVNTSNFISGQLLYLGTTGSIISTAATAPNHTVRLGEVIREQTNNGSIYVRIDNGYEIEELHDVLITSASNGDLLTRSGSVWINSKQLTGSYGLTGSINATSFTGSLFGTASWASNALTASFVQTAQTASYVLNAISSSFATTASFVITSSLALTASFVTPLVQNVIITGSVAVTQNITGSRMFLSASSNMNSGSTLTVYGSGSTQPVFTVQGSQGELFSVTDSLSGSLFSVNDISGLPILEVFSDNTTLIGNYLDPMLITTAKVTQTNSGSFVVYSLPTASYDTAFFEYSVKSGSNARAGTIMAIQSGTSVNYTETTTTDFGSTSAITLGVFVTGSNIALTGSSTTGSWTIKSIVRGL